MIAVERFERSRTLSKRARDKMKPVTRLGALGCLACMLIVAAACASAPPPPPPTPAEHDDDDRDAAAANGDDNADASVLFDASERTRPPSTASFEEATSTPEALDVNDDRVQLNDAQLTGPMRGVVSRCRVPSNAKVTIKTAVKDGRAIGVTVSVAFDHAKSKKKITKATLKAEAKISAKIVTCADAAVRAVVWPPSHRRDSFTTVF